MTPFQRHALKLREKGLSIIPIPQGTKGPIIKNWQQYCQRHAVEEEILEWEEAGYNIGLCCGTASQVVALDFDYDINGLHQKIKELVSPSPVRKKGQKGETWFYRYSGEQNKNWKKDGKPILELLSAGRQTVIPPSIHPDTKAPYFWTTEDVLGDILLPTLPTDFVAKVDALFGFTEPLKKVHSLIVDDKENIIDALGFIDPEYYYTWIEVGMALHNSLGDEGMPLWDTWSAGGSTYKPQEIPRKWASFGRSTRSSKITIGTLYHYAISGGWLPKPDEDDAFSFIINHHKETPENAPENTRRKNISGFYEKAPGFLGELYRWIESTSRRHTPELSMAAAIALAGAVYGGKIQGETHLKTNMYTLGVAPSGIGKNHAIECANALFLAVGGDLEDRLCGAFASESGMFTALEKRGGVAMAIMDEFGKTLQAFNHKNASAYQAGVPTALTKLATSANNTYRSTEYADPDLKIRKIHNPCLSVYGISEPGGFYDALQSKDASSGFLPRWLLFEMPKDLPPQKSTGANKTPPQSVLSAAQAILDMTTPQSDPLGSVKPQTLYMNEKAKDCFQAFQDGIENLQRQAIQHDDPSAPFWARAGEHALKIALIAHEDHCVDGDVMEWACLLTKASIDAMCRGVRDNVSESPFHALSNKILGKIASSQEITRNHLSRYARIPSKDLNQVLEHLAESGQIEAFTKEKTLATGKNPKYYRVTGKL